MNYKAGSFVYIAHASPQYNIVQIEYNPYDGVRIKATRHDGKAVFTLPAYILREATVAEMMTFYSRRTDYFIGQYKKAKEEIRACRTKWAELAAYQASVGRD